MGKSAYRAGPRLPGSFRSPSRSALPAATTIADFDATMIVDPAAMMIADLGVTMIADLGVTTAARVHVATHQGRRLVLRKSVLKVISPADLLTVGAGLSRPESLNNLWNALREKQCRRSSVLQALDCWNRSLIARIVSVIEMAHGTPTFHGEIPK